MVTMTTGIAKPLLILLVTFVLSFLAADAFVPIHTRLATSTESAVFLRRYSHDNDDDRKEDTDGGIPQLPAIGSSSIGGGSTDNAPNKEIKRNNDDDTKATAFVGTKFELQYTCNVCETRNCHRVSRLAYRQGVVITRCKGCDSQHLIADNLGWTDYKGGFEGSINDIEDFFKAKGMEDTVNRVSQEVFELEKILGHDTSSGAIIGENGERLME